MEGDESVTIVKTEEPSEGGGPPENSCDSCDGSDQIDSAMRAPEAQVPPQENIVAVVEYEKEKLDTEEATDNNAEEEEVGNDDTPLDVTSLPSTTDDQLDSSAERADGIDSEDFFEKISSIRIRYDDSEKRTIRDFKFSSDVVDGVIADQLWPTLGGWNVDDLYSEVLYALLHTLKGSEQAESETLVAHLQQAFHIDNDKHKKLLDAARDKQPPPLVLNLEVIEAKGLKGKDVNGLSDPFCTLFISPKQKHNTSMKPETLNPVWREYFSLPITSHQDEILTIEVWDYDPEETVSDKMKRFGEVKSTRGLRVLMKEIAMTASTGKQQHEFLGCIKIPIKTIPAGGFDKWFHLESKSGNGHKKKGEIHLRMALGAEKDKKVAAQEYRHVLHLLLVHELDEENIQPHVWDGQFSKYSEFILNQLRWQGCLLPHDIELAKWLVYARVQCEHPLNAKLFPPIFKAVMDQAKNIDDDEMRKFWFASEKLVENFSAFVRNIHQCFLTNSSTASQAYHMLKTLGLIKQHLTEAGGIKKEILGKISPELIKEKVENAVCLGAEDMVRNIIKCDSNSEESDVEFMIKVGQLLIADLRKGLESLNNVFRELLRVDFFDVTYRVYDREYAEVVLPVVTKAVKELKPVGMSGHEGPEQDRRMSSGTVLFELYLAIKQFADLSSNLESQNDLCIQGSYHLWFHSIVAQWLDIAWYKALKRIQKAVQLDTLRPVTDGAQITSSEVDTAQIFHQIQIFWDQLSWPDVEGQYTFIAKILDDLCLCIIRYAEIMCKKVEDLERRQDEEYEVSDELCLAINNIEYVGREMQPISQKLRMNEILDQMEARNGPESAAQCRRTLSTVMQNATESVNNKIYDILANVGAKMEPVIFRLLLEGAETDNVDEGIEKLMRYLDKNLLKLKRKMTPSGFDKVFAIIWENASIALKDLIRTNVEKRRPPEFFQRIHNMMQILLDFFYPDGPTGVEVIQNSNIREVQDLIGLHGARTSDLILKFIQERYKRQVANKGQRSENGMVTFRVTYCDDIETMKVEILSCRQLRPCDSNGLCDPFVKVQLLPYELYPIPSKKTKVKKKTLCPLFDEIFAIPLSIDSMSQGGILYLGVKDHDLFGRNDFLGEAFMPLESIPFTTSNTKLQDLPQINLSLSRPTTEGLLILQTLESRTWDQEAVRFAKKQRSKMDCGVGARGSNNNNGSP